MIVLKNWPNFEMNDNQKFYFINLIKNFSKLKRFVTPEEILDYYYDIRLEYY